MCEQVNRNTCFLLTYLQEWLDRTHQKLKKKQNLMYHPIQIYGITHQILFIFPKTTIGGNLLWKYCILWLFDPSSLFVLLLPVHIIYLQYCINWFMKNNLISSNITWSIGKVWSRHACGSDIHEPYMWYATSDLCTWYVIPGLDWWLVSTKKRKGINFDHDSTSRKHIH